jgi:hypothetical protein
MKNVGEILIMAALGVGVLWASLTLIGLINDWSSSAF